MNLYDNSALTTKYLALGGHLNLYGGSVTISNALLTGTATAGVWGGISTDSTRMINLIYGKLIIAGDATATINDMISRGIIEGFSTVGNVNIDTTSDPGFTVVTAVPEPGIASLLGLGALGLVSLRRKPRC